MNLRHQTSRRSFLKATGGLIGGSLLADAKAGEVKRPAKRFDYYRIRAGVWRSKSLKILRTSVFRKGATKTIILMDDYHGGEKAHGWKANFDALEEIRRNTGISNVLIEGWAGHQADQQRGYRLLNAEEQLIEKLLEDRNYSVSGLEDKKAQEMIFKQELWDYHIKLEQIEKDIEERKRNPRTGELITQDQRARIREAYSKALEETARKLGLKPDKTTIEKIRGELVSYFGDIYDYSSLEKLRLKEHVNRTLNSRRESAAISKIAQEINSPANVNAAIVVFGAAHSEDLIKELKKHREFNILHVHNPQERRSWINFFRDTLSGGGKK